MRALAVRTFLSFLSSSYSYLAWLSVELFVCVDVGPPDGLRLRAFAEISCYSREWYGYLPTAVMGLALYVLGIPALQLWLLRRFEWGESADAAAYLGYRVTGYRRGFRWWDAADIVWRLCVALSIQLLMEAPTAQVTLFSLLVAGRLAVQRRFRPFVEEINNVHENALQWLTLGVLFCGVVFYAARARLSDAWQGFFFVLTAAQLVTIALSLLYSTVKAFRTRHKPLLQEQEYVVAVAPRGSSADVDRDVVLLARPSRSASNGSGYLGPDGDAREDESMAVGALLRPRTSSGDLSASSDARASLLSREHAPAGGTLSSDGRHAR